MLIRASFACVIFAVSQSSGATPSAAAEAFLCDKARVVYAEIDQLDELKRTDACVASYFGITLAPSAAAAPAPSAMPAVPPSPTAPLDLKTLTETAPTQRFVPGQYSRQRVAALDGARLPRPAASAAPGTDFRNVRVVNPSQGDGWFRHAR